jgi:hypothetical protein
MAGATFDAFRNRGKNGVLTGAALLYLLLVLAGTAALWALAWRGYLDYIGWWLDIVRSSGGGAQPTPEMFMPPASAMNVGNLGFLFSVAFYILLAAFEAGCLRWLARGETRGVFGLSLTAGDTWLVWASYWVWVGLVIGLYIALLVVGVITGLVIAALHLEPAVIVIIVAACILALMCALIWAGVRLAPATATSVVLQRFAFFDAWKVTRGRFWTLLGSYLLLIIIYLLAAAVIGAIAIIPFFSVVQPLMSGTANGMVPTADQLRAVLFTPTNLAAIGAIIVLSFIVRTIVMIAFFGVNARAAVVAKAEGRIS